MPKFISDEDMAKLDPPKKGFISDEEMADLESSEPTLGQKAKGLFEDTVVDQLPALGAAGGGMVGGLGGMGIGSVPGALAGAGIGGYTGKALQNAYNAAFRPELGPKSDIEALTSPLQSGAEGVASEGLGMGVGKGIAAASRAAAPAIGAVTRKLTPVGEYLKEKLGTGLSKVGAMASGLDDEALKRQFMRPKQIAAAEGENFKRDLSSQVQAAIESRGKQVGQGVGQAEEAFMKDFGAKQFDNASSLPASVDSFLEKSKPSSQGFSPLSDEEWQTLSEISAALKKGPTTGEDLLKLRNHIDHVENVAGKYDQDGTGPFINYLKKLRGEADRLVDTADPRLDIANKAFSQHKDDTGLVRGMLKEGTAESAVDNLYGANKSAAQGAAGRLLSDDPSLLEAAKDIAANKAVGKQGPAGSGRGIRNLLSAGATGIGLADPNNRETAFTLAALAQPATWKYGLRGLGRVAQGLGKFGPMLEQSAARGPQSLQTTLRILSHNPEFQDAIKVMGGAAMEDE